MIAVGIYSDGRMGNGLFQYAFVYARHKDSGAPFFLNQIRQNFEAKEYFELTSFKPMQSALLSKLFQKWPSLFTSIHEADYGSKTGHAPYYIGYFQNERYFEKYIPEIKKQFEIKKEYKLPFESKYGELFAQNKTIAIHIRRSDLLNLYAYKGAAVNATLPESYYLHCFDQIGNMDGYKIIFATDDIAYAKEKYGHWPNAVIEEKNSITDFQMLMNADIVISASSSFSWMAAYLNKKPGKRVYTPENWGVIPRILPPDSETTKWITV